MNTETSPKKGAAMKNALTALLAIFLLGLPASARATGHEPVRLAVRVFQIPADQSFRIERPDGRGGTLSLQACGNIASGFPRGTVIVPTELARNAADSTVGRAIGENIVMGFGDLRALDFQAHELKAFEFNLMTGRPAQEARFQESRGEGRSSDYDLSAEVLTVESGKVLVRLQLDVGSSWQAGTLAGGLTGQVISAVVEVPESRLLLVGAPGDKAVYFLAVCVAPR
jgi:hypothetical protein